MKITITIIVAILMAFLVTSTVSGQTAEPGTFAVGQKVEVEYIPDSGKWYAADIIEILNDGYSYKVSVAPYGNGKTIQTNIHYKRVRPGSTGPNNTVMEKPASGALVFGKYGCTASRYQNGAYEYIARGSFVITKGGKYSYYGFEKPSTGSFTIDRAGNLSFKGGYLDSGTATKVDRPNKFFLVFPTNPDNRWTCGLVG